MKRSTILSTAVLALVFASSSSAMAAPSLSFTSVKNEEFSTELSHEQVQIYRGDERVFYSVKLKNVGTEPTSNTVNVSISLPGGLKVFSGSGGSAGKFWVCHPSAGICSNSGVFAAGEELPPLTVNAWIYPSEAPSTVTAEFSAFGGGALADAFAADSFSFGPERNFEVAGLTAKTENEAQLDYTQAGGHPFSATSAFSIPTYLTPVLPIAQAFTGRAPVENLRDLSFELPAGFIGNPEGVAQICTVAQVSENLCPESAAVGGVDIDTAQGDVTSEATPIYRVLAEEGYPAAFAFHPVPLSPLTYVLRARLRSNGDYGVTAVAPLPPQSPALVGFKFATLCGYGASVQPSGTIIKFLSCKKPGQPGSSGVPFLTNPTKCASQAPVTKVEIDSYQHAGANDGEGFADLSDPNWKTASVTSPAPTGCGLLTEAWVGEGSHPTEPSFEFQPDSGQAATPAAYSAHLHIPQPGLLRQGGLGTADLKDTTVVLPDGVALNPSAATGLGACSEDQAGLVGTDFPAPNPIHFNTTAAGCPGNSKVGTVEARTPILGKPLFGSVYLAAQDANPFGSRFAIYLTVNDPETGTDVTLAGKVSLNEKMGQVTTTFQNNPQVPLEDIEIDFFGGPRASLANPDVCGAYTTETDLTPWSAVDPDHPAPDEIAVSHDQIAIETAPEGQSTCPHTKAERPFNLGFSAGSTDSTAGAHSPFALRLARPDGNQELDKISVTTPPGFAATLKGVATCSWANVEAAANRSKGADEIAHPSCPASSQVGTTTIGAGVGSNPYYVKTGKAYLSGPYKGAPVSLTFIVPAVAGPFDLGVQVVKTALDIDPKTAQVTAVSDPIPQILDGIPLQIRDVQVNLDRSNFALNPTNCEPMSIAAKVTGGSGAVSNLQNRFQVGNCAALKFHPDLAIQLHGGTKRGDYQRLQATVTYPKKGAYANIARAAVTFPHSAFLAQEHIRTVCTRVQFAAHACPKGSIYGHAEATTPLLDGKLSGPVYLRSSDNLLPDLVAALRGPDSQPIEVELAGRTDSKHGGIRNTFEMVPDAPVSEFKLTLLGGKKSLIVNSRNLCNGVQRATVRMDAQNGKVRNVRTVVGNDCGKGKGGHKSHKHSKHHASNRLAWLRGW